MGQYQEWWRNALSPIEEMWVSKTGGTRRLPRSLADSIRAEARSYPPPPFVNKADQSDCEACTTHDYPCLYHEGFFDGWDAAQRHVERALSEPESVTFPVSEKPHDD